jgi:hypothetical protein
MRQGLVKGPGRPNRADQIIATMNNCGRNFFEYVSVLQELIRLDPGIVHKIVILYYGQTLGLFVTTGIGFGF